MTDGLCNWSLVLTTHNWWQSTVCMVPVLFHAYTILISITSCPKHATAECTVLFLFVQISSTSRQATTDSLCWLVVDDPYLITSTVCTVLFCTILIISCPKHTRRMVLFLYYVQISLTYWKATTDSLSWIGTNKLPRTDYNALYTYGSFSYIH